MIDAPPESDASAGDWRLYALLALVTTCAFAQVATFDWVYLDDDIHVYANPGVRAGLTQESLRWAFSDTRFAWQPLTWLSHQAGFEAFGDRAGGHHLLNLLLHVANVLLLYRVLLSLTGATGRSLFVAFVFAVHPTHVESVAWVSERKDVLSTLFGFAALAVWVRHVRAPSPARYVATFALLAASLMSKPLFVTFPCVLLLLDAWPLRRLAWPTGGEGVSLARLVAEKLPFFALVVAVSAVTIWAQEEGGALMGVATASPIFRVLRAACAYLAYLGAIFWPVGLIPVHPLVDAGVTLVRGLVSLGVLAVLTGLALWQARRRPWFLVGWLWFIGTLVPMIGLVQVGEQFVNDRYLYLPLVGVAIVVAWACDEVLANASLKRGLAAVVVAVCLALTLVQVSRWRNTFTLFEYTLRITPDNYWAHLSLGRAHEVARDYDRAAFHYARVVDRRPRFSHGLGGLANAELGRGRTGEAVLLYRRAVAAAPHDALPLTNLGIALERQGRDAEARDVYRRALALDPANPDLLARLERLGGQEGLQDAR